MTPQLLAHSNLMRVKSVNFIHFPARATFLLASPAVVFRGLGGGDTSPLKTTAWEATFLHSKRILVKACLQY